METHVDKVLISRGVIESRVGELADEIAADFRAEHDNPNITIIPVMTGSLIFVSDLIRRLPLLMRINMVTVGSYPGRATAAQKLQWKTPLPDNLGGAHVLLVDDILDSGQTVAAVRDAIAQQQPALVKTCVFLRKKRPSAMKTPVDYVGFDIADEFVVGYGLDYDGYYRNLPEVVTLKENVIRDLK